MNDRTFAITAVVLIWSVFFFFGFLPFVYPAEASLKDCDCYEIWDAKQGNYTVDCGGVIYMEGNLIRPPDRLFLPDGYTVCTLNRVTYELSKMKGELND